MGTDLKARLGSARLNYEAALMIPKTVNRVAAQQNPPNCDRQHIGSQSPGSWCGHGDRQTGTEWEPHNLGDLTMKKIILAAAAFASLTVLESAPASAFGCRTAFVDGRIVSICNSAVGGTMIGRPRCVQRPGFNQPYICR